MYDNDKRIVLTLDAGGTNFVFSAIQANKEIVQPIVMPAQADDLDKCLSSLVDGFNQVKSHLDEEPVAISFAFPGPADYEHGVIGDLPNFPAFRGGVALGAFLEEKFNIPVFINNDGNLFAYGEALAGILPDVNKRLEAAGNPKRYKNILGITFGTGFGAGVVIDQVLHTGDNGCGGDVWVLSNCKHPGMIAEESVSIRAIKRVYNEHAKETDSTLTPKDIFDIAQGTRTGDRDAAIKSFQEFGEVAGASIAEALTLVDGLVVIGGGLTGAASYILPSMIARMREQAGTFAGDKFPCLQMKVYDLTDESEFSRFSENKSTVLKVPQSNRTVIYEKEKQIGVALSRLGASTAISLGAYAFALSQLNK